MDGIDQVRHGLNLTQCQEFDPGLDVWTRAVTWSIRSKQFPQNYPHQYGDLGDRALSPSGNAANVGDFLCDFSRWGECRPLPVLHLG